MNKDIILFSGGKESLYQLHLRRDSISLLLHFNYGQMSFGNEYKALEYYSILYNKDFEVINLPFFDLPPSIKNGVDCNPDVPFRNYIFIAIALHYANTHNYQHVYLGAIADADSYDAHPEFIDDYNNTIWDYGNRIVSISKNKTTDTIYKSLIRNKVDISHIWSCDTSSITNEKFCGKCAKCTSSLHRYINEWRNDKLITSYFYKKYDLKNSIDSLYKNPKYCETKQE